jgi:multiple antibiotic resistance protein
LPILAAVLLLIVMPGSAYAEASDVVTRQGLSPQKIFALLFLMLGPIKILAPFVRATRDTDAAFRRKLATRAVLFSSGALLIAGLMGQRMLENFDVPVPVLALTGGLVLFLIALQTLLQQFADPVRPQQEARKPTLALAVNPIAFPTIVTPYGIAATIIFMTLAQDNLELQLLISGLIVLILLLDWLAMLYAHVILRYCGTVLQVFAVVLGVNQVALGLYVILRSLSQIGLFTMQVR